MSPHIQDFSMIMRMRVRMFDGLYGEIVGDSLVFHEKKKSLWASPGLRVKILLSQIYTQLLMCITAGPWLSLNAGE